jgi:hypothetical protein
MEKTSGVRTVPEPVAVLPRTPCTKSGVYRMIPNIPMPTQNISSEAEVNTLLLNSESGMTGSAARNSIGTNAPSRTPEMMNPATTPRASQAYPSPTQERERSKETTEAVTVAAPR